MQRPRSKSGVGSFLAVSLLSLAGCHPPETEPPNDSDPTHMSEKSLTVGLSLSGTTLTVTAKDGEVPVMTDLWLYTQHEGTLTAFTGFKDPDSKRKHRGLMMPCTLGGAPSQLVPCNNGEQNGVLTDLLIDTLVAGSTTEKKTAIDGTVALTLNAALTETLVVVVGKEDQRYAGAAAITPDGQPAAVPAGVGAPETHKIVKYSDVKSLLDTRCVVCHSASGVAAGFPLDTYEHVVHFNFAYGEEKEKCETATPGNQTAIDACIAAITKTEYMIDPGSPANSALLRRALPDENKSVSTIGLLWYGSKGSRFGDHGDRRMPALNITASTADDEAAPTYFDQNPADYQLLWDWVAQGAQQ